MPLVIYALGGAYTYTHTHKQTFLGKQSLETRCTPGLKRGRLFSKNLLILLYSFAIVTVAPFRMQTM